MEGGRRDEEGKSRAGGGGGGGGGPSQTFLSGGGEVLAGWLECRGRDLETGARVQSPAVQQTGEGERASAKKALILARGLELLTRLPWARLALGRSLALAMYGCNSQAKGSKPLVLLYML